MASEATVLSVQYLEQRSSLFSANVKLSMTVILFELATKLCPKNVFQSLLQLHVVLSSALMGSLSVDHHRQDAEQRVFTDGFS